MDTFVGVFLAGFEGLDLEGGGGGGGGGGEGGVGGGDGGMGGPGGEVFPPEEYSSSISLSSETSVQSPKDLDMMCKLV